MVEENKVCRICLNPGEISIFSVSAASASENETNAKYSDQITRCTRIQISENDGFPSKICSVCEAELTVSFRFLVKCEASDALLRKLKYEQTFSVPKNIKFEVKEEEFDDNIMTEEYLDAEEGTNNLESCMERLCSKKTKKIKSSETKTMKENNLESRRTTILKKKSARPRKNPDFLSKYVKKCGKNSSPSIPCEICGLLVKCRSAMEIHMRVHSHEKPFACTECSAAFKAKGTLKRHYQVRHTQRERKFVCESCGDRFYCKRDIIIHLRTHTGEKPYSCDLCEKKFTQQGPLIRHKRTHTGEKPYGCPLCSKKFIDKTMVKKHLTVHSEERKFVCYLCGKAVKSKQALKSHMRLHTNEKTYICSFCGITLSTKGNLKNHTVRVHSERSGQCGVCHKTFSDVAQHMNKHTGDLPYKCTECPRAFASLRSLSNHVKFRHINTGKFKCSHVGCDATFPMPAMLQFHLLKQHMNETPYVCEHCSRGFFRASDLSRHMRVSHLHLVKMESSLSVSKLIKND